MPGEGLKARIGGGLLELVQGDITKQKVDALVNAANSSLAGGGGVDGAIHRVGGPGIMEACVKIGGCPTGQAVATTAGRLQASHVIHAVGPVWRGGLSNEPALLASAYRAAFHLAADLKLARVAAPSLSTGAYGYPLHQAASIAVAEGARALNERPELTLIRFVLFDAAALSAFRDALAEEVRVSGWRMA
ncbi:MAG: O-acetyl-ADP-ribose deacetylase [Candidatus Polarisedimenticolia bacterium]